MLGVTACDSSSDASGRDVAIGPARDAFPQDALFAPDDIASLVAQHTDAQFGVGDTLVLVPLVFDQNGYLYSPLGFNLALQTALDSQPAEGTGPDGTLGDTYFTDEATFEAVVAGGGSSQLLYSEKTGPSTEIEEGSEVPVRFRDIYSCENNPGDCPSSGMRVEGDLPPPPPNNPPPPPPSRGNWSTGTVATGTVPTWTSMWRGDVVSGNIDNINPFGHTSIITQLHNFQDTGGIFGDERTKVMEAVGYGGPSSNEVIERPARVYWLDQGQHVDNVVVLYHPTAGWTRRSEAIAYARAQDPDVYSAFTPKFDRRRWYCSKLIWRAYRQATGDDLDHDWGYFVFPGDIENSNILHTAYRFRYQS